jgi:hypothetical protein
MGPREAQIVQAVPRVREVEGQREVSETLIGEVETDLPQEVWALLIDRSGDVDRGSHAPGDPVEPGRRAGQSPCWEVDGGTQRHKEALGPSQATALHTTLVSRRPGGQSNARNGRMFWVTQDIR